MKYTGIVVHGKGEARLLGTPTANILMNKSEKEGIYAGYMSVFSGSSSSVFDACIYISTVSNGHKIEAYAIDKQGLELYDKEITVEILGCVRGIQSFSGISFEECKARVNKDVEMCKSFLRVHKCLSPFKQGHPVIIMDDLERENEGDLVYPAQYITHKDVCDILTCSSGIICVTLTEERAYLLGLHAMVQNNEDPNGTNFTVSVDHISTTTGVSAYDRAKTIRELVSSTSPRDFTRPGHIFPLVAKNGLLQERKGHTEASIQLCLLSGVEPVGVICELMNRNGTMMRLNECKQLSHQHNIPLISVKDIEVYSACSQFQPLLQQPSLNWSDCELTIQNYENTPFIFRVAKDHFMQKEIGMLCTRGFDAKKNPLIRIHSECLTGNVFHSLHCDCYHQLHHSIQQIAQDGNGCVIYVSNHEGRGIGLLDKIKAYKLQAQGEDTVSANIKLGWKDDHRDYSFCVRVLHEMRVSEFRMLTNNPTKLQAFSTFNVVAVPFKSEIHHLNKTYLHTKVNRMNHASELIRQMSNENVIFHFDSEQVKGKHICIVNTIWNKEYTQVATTKLIKVLQSAGVMVTVVTVPGAFEIPIKCKQLFNHTHLRGEYGKKIEAIIAVGVVLKGETMHFEYICESVYKGLMDVQLSEGKPIINGVLTCLTKKQIEDRIYSSLPEDWARSALMML